MRAGVINNIWLFVPLGTGLYRIFQKKWVLLIPFVFSILIETTQYITGLGIAEFDDVFGNTLGGWIGVVIALMCAKNMGTWKKLVPDRASSKGCTIRRVEIPSNKLLTTAFEASLECVTVM